ncbi:MAG TPA: helix-turn-helix transcriptional regulator [Trebonia sp.]|nr:helix-turn-helix transcriptional regulator [Trebonia sp.]
MNAPDYQVTLGRKIAGQRRRRGLSQPELARMIDRSVAWVSQVERGVRKVDRMSVLETLATALDMPLSELAADAPVVAAVNEALPGTAGLRLVLSGAWSLRAMLNGRHAPSPAEMRAKADRAWTLTREGRYADLADLLRDLVPELESGARAVAETERAGLFELLAAAYQACSAALAELDEPDAAWIAADRGMAAAERAGSPLLVAAGAFRLVIVFLGARYYTQAEETARTAADALWHIADGGTPEAMSMWGALTLQRAVVAAHLGDAAAAYGYLDRARLVAGQVGPGRNDYNTEFGPANLALYEIAVAVELGDAGRALRAAGTVDVSGLSAERRARMFIDVARAHAQRRQVAQAVEALRQAEDLAPEQVHAHALVRQVVADLFAMQNPASPELAALSQRIAIS